MGLVFTRKHYHPKLILTIEKTMAVMVISELQIKHFILINSTRQAYEKKMSLTMLTVYVHVYIKSNNPP